jgi:hypothetical protein
MKHQVDTLDGPLLDAAVAQAVFEDGQKPANIFAPSRLWDHGGPIIEREEITLARVPAGPRGREWMACANYSEAGSEGSRSFDSMPLVAAMRAYVRAKLGDEVDLP